MERNQTQNRPMLWRWFIVLSLSIGFGIQWLPTGGQDMLEVFNSLADSTEKKSSEFKEVLAKVIVLQKQAKGGELTLEKWEEAIGPASLTNYFSLKDEFKIDKAAREKMGLNADLGPDISQGATQAEQIEIIETTRKASNRFILGKLQSIAAGKVKLGLDLRGGTQFTVRIVSAGAKVDANKRKDRLEQAMETIRKRIDKFGVSEPIIQSSSSDTADHIIIQIPGLSKADRDRARDTIQKIAKLEFRLEHARSRVAMNSGEDFVPGSDFLNYKYKDEDGNKLTRSLFVVTMDVYPEKCVSGVHIVDASPIRDPISGMAKISFKLDGEGADKFAKITKEHQVSGNDPRALCIVLDGELISAPSINSRIHSRGEISGDFTFDEARELANALENPLETPVEIIEERDVDPSLGRESVAKGFAAAKWGLIAVAVFMLVYYLLSGVVANIALAMNILILMGVLCWFDATLTLPGIAGVVLTIGMAVDANVLIFERIREELRAGKSLKGAISSGYEKAFGTIFDANITTLIASVILIYMGKGPVQGFGVTLTIGILTSMFTALVATRLVLDLLLNIGWIGSEGSKRAMHLRPTAGLPAINFVKYKVGATRGANAIKSPAVLITWVLIMFCTVYVITRGWDKTMGVDFAGGQSLMMSFDNDKATIDSEKLQSDLSVKLSMGDSGLQVQPQTDLSSGNQVLRVSYKDGDPTRVIDELNQIHPEANFSLLSKDLVGPSVSGEIQKSALVATVLALFGILIYVAFRYEYSFAVGAIIAVLHDVLLTGGLFFLSGRELNAPIVAAILTIIGFSINDTIVIFDRIRENLRLGTRGTFADVMNAALNQTLSRTIITSGTTLLSTATLYFYGGTVINDFAFMFLVGIITGTYSSIYIACAVVLWWHEGKRPELAAPIQDADPVTVNV
jgi:SecD/SecF fusion protein